MSTIIKTGAQVRWDTVKQYERLHDGLSDMIEGGRLTEADIPDDYQWLVETLVQCNARDTGNDSRYRTDNMLRRPAVMVYGVRNTMNTLNDALEMWQVHECDEVNAAIGGAPILPGWFAVSNDDGIVAYFGSETDAFRFRLAEINRTLNG